MKRAPKLSGAERSELEILHGYSVYDSGEAKAVRRVGWGDLGGGVDLVDIRDGKLVY